MVDNIPNDERQRGVTPKTESLDAEHQKAEPQNAATQSKAPSTGEPQDLQGGNLESSGKSQGAHKANSQGGDSQSEDSKSEESEVQNSSDSTSGSERGAQKSEDQDVCDRIGRPPEPIHPSYEIRKFLNKLAIKLTIESKRPQIAQIFFAGVTWFTGLLLALLEHISTWPKDEKTITSLTVKYIVENRQEIAVGLVSVLVICGIANLTIALIVKFMSPIDLVAAKRILDRLSHRTLQEVSKDGVIDNHKVTLFKIRKGPFGYCGEWAGVVCRSGEFTQKSNTIFSLNRNGALQECTGLIGMSFLLASHLEMEKQSNDQPENYMNYCYLTEQEYEDLTNKPNYLYVVHIKKVPNPKKYPTEPCWGFLCLDSNTTKNLSDKKRERIQLLAEEAAESIRHIIK